MSRDAEPKQVIVYQDEKGREPFTEWLTGLQDAKARRQVLRRLSRLEHGNFGDCAPIGEGLSEMRIHYGPGYRVYFREIGNDRIVILCGGTKRTQTKDIARAKEYWKELKSHDQDI